MKKDEYCTIYANVEYDGEFYGGRIIRITRKEFLHWLKTYTDFDQTPTEYDFINDFIGDDKYDAEILTEIEPLIVSGLYTIETMTSYEIWTSKEFVEDYKQVNSKIKFNGYNCK